MKTPVLVLNANYEPLHVCDTRRALHLIIGGKARLVINGRGYVHTVRLTLPCPSVIQLQKMIHPPRPLSRIFPKRKSSAGTITPASIAAGVRCILRSITSFPRHRGGAHVWENLVAACPPCNRNKGGRLPDEAHMHLRTPPREPPRSALYLFGHYLDDFSEWRTYLEGW